MNNEENEDLWDVEQTAKYLGLKPFTVRSWVRIGRIPASVNGRVIRFVPADIRAWVKRNMNPRAR